ncbi:ribonuclease HII [Spiribacter pallidus]|uniref:Ribonuclease HII n=1 Tax=Spiribacter pallidus TaxID=1987936 RepID=A0ABV3TC21_9GAMM
MDSRLPDPGVAGVDEVGRGPLAGPVVAAAVILDADAELPGLRDSKKLTAGRRGVLDEMIRQRARAWAIGLAEVEEIDRLNIRGATLLAMQRAVHQLTPAPRLVLVDGRDVPPLPYPASAVVGGDNAVAAIAAASIVAKVHRDRLMQALHERYPDYGLDRNMGYPSAHHREQLQRLGPSPAHRRSFAPVARALRGDAPGG